MAENLTADAVVAKTATGTENANATTTSNASDEQPTIVAATKSLDLETLSEEESNSTNTEGSPPAEKGEAEIVTIENTPIIARKAPMTIDTLPNELLSQIFGFLDIPPPSTNSADLLDEPKFELTDAATADLKTSSRVSKRWREATLPTLFRHARFVIAKPEPKMLVHNLMKEIQPFLEFVNKNAMVKIITTFVLAVNDRSITGDEYVPEHKLDVFADFWRLLFQTIDPVELLVIAHPQILGRFTSCHVYKADTWNFDCPCHYLRLQRPAALPTQPTITEKAVLPHEYPTSLDAHEVAEPVTSNFSVENVPEDLLKHEPTPVMINGSSESPAGLTDSTPEPSSSGSGRLVDAALEPLQILHPQASTLFEIRPWSTILLNEGSFIKAYSTYEFWLRQAPSVSFLANSKLQILMRCTDFVRYGWSRWPTLRFSH
jgi:hypothetical protein